MKSIIQSERECFICGSPYVEEHHIFGGAYRKKSEQYGLKVFLCHCDHNEPPNGVHHNKSTMQYFHELGQKAFEKHYPDKDFRKEFGRNYL
jgi:hypothetical protein